MDERYEREGTWFIILNGQFFDTGEFAGKDIKTAPVSKPKPYLIPVPTPEPEPEVEEPTATEIWNYIINIDTTDQNDYIPGEYVCSNFARDLTNNLVNFGADAHYFSVDTPNGRHAIVFIKIDGKVMLVEPQSDTLVFDKYDRDGDGNLEYNIESKHTIWTEGGVTYLAPGFTFTDFATDDGIYVLDVDGKY